MKRKIILSSQYKKDVKLARRRHLPEEELNDIVLKLANDIPLPIENRDHPLKGDYIGYRECRMSYTTRLASDIEEDRQQRVLPFGYVQGIAF